MKIKYIDGTQDAIILKYSGRGRNRFRMFFRFNIYSLIVENSEYLGIKNRK